MRLTALFGFGWIGLDWIGLVVDGHFTGLPRPCQWGCLRIPAVRTAPALHSAHAFALVVEQIQLLGLLVGREVHLIERHKRSVQERSACYARNE